MSSASFWIVAKRSLLLGLIAAATLTQAESLKLVTAIPADLPVWGAVDQALQHIFHRAELDYSVAHFPAERATQLLLKHRFDGDVARAAVYGELAPQLHRISPPFFSSWLLALSVKGELRPRNPDDLRRLRVAYIRGFQFAQQLAANGQSSQAVDSVDACLRLVLAGRDDVCIANRYLVAKAAAQPGYNGVFYLDRIARVDTYLYLDRQHWARAEQLRGLLARMQRTGELARLNQSINQVVDQELKLVAQPDASMAASSRPGAV